MTANLVHHVEATFGGRQVRFDLRDEIAALEVSLGGGAYSCLRRLVSGEWALRDLQLVLSAAIPFDLSEVPSNSVEAKLKRADRRLAEYTGISAGVAESPFVLRVLKENPPARYAVLALKVLEAGLFGIASDQATFDEGAVEVAA